jgi:hypothetical protein
MATRTAKAPKATASPAPERRREEELPAPTPPTRQELSADAIRLRAYLKWEAAGMPPGDGLHFWLDAEKELLQEK